MSRWRTILLLKKLGHFRSPANAANESIITAHTHATKFILFIIYVLLRFGLMEIFNNAFSLTNGYCKCIILSEIQRDLTVYDIDRTDGFLSLVGNFGNPRFLDVFPVR